MGFSTKQVKALRRNPDSRFIRKREAHGRELTYLEGWYAISEANRIFGFDGWSRETIESRCVLARENRGSFTAVYIARVRLTVTADGVTLVREGHGTGEGYGTSAGEVHDVAIKAAETDGTKRALATFGRPFGLELYRSSRPAPRQKQLPSPPTSPESSPRSGLHPDDTTPIPRPSRYYGRPRDEIAETLRKERREAEKAHQPDSIRRSLPPSPSPALSPATPRKIDKSELGIAEPKRLRDKAHLKFVATQPCLICGRQPSDAHHLRFAQPRAIGLKVSDEFTVPLCRGHHRELHQVGNEQSWWSGRNIIPLQTARTLWEQTHPNVVTSDPSPKQSVEAAPHE